MDPLLRDIRIFLPKFSGLKEGDNILDICSATGEQVFYYARSGARALGIDLDPKMVELAQKNKKEQGLTDVSFQVADARKLPFKDSFFDFASICLGLHQLDGEGRASALVEMKRVVKKEGFLIFVDYTVPLPGNLYSFLIKNVEALAGKEHSQNFKSYLGSGGLPFFLKEHNLVEEKIHYFKKGNLTAVRAKNQN